MAELDKILHRETTKLCVDLQDQFGYCISNHGKRLRPLLGFLSAGPFFAEENAERVTLGMAAVELIHLASLIHDDVLDKAEMRHTLMTVHRKFGSKTAVLIGDALFSLAFRLVTELEDIHIFSQLSVAVRRMCEGELRQDFYSSNQTVPKLEDYFDTIAMKTGELFSLACFMGSKLSQKDIRRDLSLTQFGLHLGIAYQILDDIIDYSSNEKMTGKSIGTDYLEGRWTLPLILFYERASSTQRKLVSKRTKKNFLSLRSEMDNLQIFAEASHILKKQLILAFEFLQPLEAPTASQLQEFAGVLF
ncbi:MAG: hypothetical protein A2007_01165 [Verrucomicrobia bacterium GWC2_42_7]|nr:MAG: hypothetical protein A2007_01165 [Verrucomicrobia bacterium GWC2_42_7]